MFGALVDSLAGYLRLLQLVDLLLDWWLVPWLADWLAVQRLLVGGWFLGWLPDCYLTGGLVGRAETVGWWLVPWLVA